MTYLVFDLHISSSSKEHPEDLNIALGSSKMESSSLIVLYTHNEHFRIHNIV